MQEKQPVIETEDVARWFVFGGFWGFVFYLLSFIGLLVGHRRQPVQVNMRPVMLGLGIQVVGFIGFTSVFSAAQAVITGKSSSRMARERISGGTLEQSVVKLGLGASLVSLLPFAMSVGSIRTAEKVTHESTFANQDEIRWPVAVATSATLSSITGLAVARITSWVARDSREGPR